MSKTIQGPHDKPRCRWCGAAPEFFDYHDTEWGFPVSDDHRLFEKKPLTEAHWHHCDACKDAGGRATQEAKYNRRAVR